ncbi:MAG: hypothetical protein ABI693_19875 [Bryobacteraceae bacterium]
MWLCFNDGFVSVVSDKEDHTRLLVRARRRRDLLNLLGADMELVENARADYRWRAVVDRKVFSALVSARVEAIDYPNFKNSVADRDLHDLYMDFWGLHRRYQDREKQN